MTMEKNEKMRVQKVFTREFSFVNLISPPKNLTCQDQSDEDLGRLSQSQSLSKSRLPEEK